MKMYEVERLLLDGDEAGKLVKQARRYQRLYVDTGGSEGEAAARLRPTEPPAHLLVGGKGPPAVDDDHLEHWPLLEAGLVRELDSEDPKPALAELIGRCRKQRSDANELLLEDAVNRLTTVGHVDAEGEKLIDDAVALLAAAPREKASSADSVSTRLYADRDFRGRSLFVNHRRGATYRRISERLLDHVGLDDDISSLYVDASEGEAGGEVILFDDDRFYGDFRRFSTDPGPERNEVHNVGRYIEDRATSALIVRRFQNEIALPLSTMGVIDQIRSTVERIPQIDVRGTPRITWDMWPDGGDDHPNDPGKRFLEIKIPVVIDVPNWFDYDAEIRLWIYLYLDDGVLQGYTAWYGAWVEFGIIRSCVLDRLMERLGNYVGRVDRMVATALALANSFGPLRRQYLLPGPGSRSGNTEDDVTLVLVRA